MSFTVFGPPQSWKSSRDSPAHTAYRDFAQCCGGRILPTCAIRAKRHSIRSRRALVAEVTRTTGRDLGLAPKTDFWGKLSQLSGPQKFRLAKYNPTQASPVNARITDGGAGVAGGVAWTLPTNS